MVNKFHRNCRSVIEDAAAEHNVVIGLPDELERRLRVPTLAVTANSAQKRHSGKKKNASCAQVERQKELEVGHKNMTQSTHGGDKSSTLVSVM